MKGRKRKERENVRMRWEKEGEEKIGKEREKRGTKKGGRY